MLLHTLYQVLRASPVVIEAAGHSYKQTMELLYLEDLIEAIADLNISWIKPRIRPAWTCYDRFKGELYDMKDALFMLKVFLLNTEAMDTLLYSWVLGSRPGALR